MHPLATIGAAVAAIVGAVIWYAIGSSTGMQIGLVAWGIGGLVGTASYALGGRGTPAGIIAGALALLSILGGRSALIDVEIGDHFESQIPRHVYKEAMESVASYPGDEDTKELKEFLVLQGYEDTSDEAVEAFLENVAPLYDRWKREKPTYIAWRAELAERRKIAFLEEQGRFNVLKESVGPMGLLFMILGIVTAFKIAAREEDAVVPIP